MSVPVKRFRDVDSQVAGERPELHYVPSACHPDEGPSAVSGSVGLTWVAGMPRTTSVATNAGDGPSFLDTWVRPNHAQAPSEGEAGERLSLEPAL
jgi:hypothetical protein